jgi:hypothetical protein
MSTRKEPRTAGEARQRSLFGGYHTPRSAEEIQRAIMAALLEDDFRLIPREVVTAMMEPKVFPEIMPTADDNDPRFTHPFTREEIRCLVARALASGFMHALVRYQKQLKGVPALASFYKRRAQGQKKGHESQSQRRQDRAAQAMAMIKKGVGIREVVEHFRSNGMPRCSKTTVHRWLKLKPSKLQR